MNINQTLRILSSSITIVDCASAGTLPVTVSQADFGQKKKIKHIIIIEYFYKEWCIIIIKLKESIGFMKIVYCSK